MGIEKVEHHGCRYAVRSDRCGLSLTNLLLARGLARRHARRSLSLQPIQVRHPNVYDQSAICQKRGNTHNHHDKAAAQCEKKTKSKTRSPAFT